VATGLSHAGQDLYLNKKSGSDFITSAQDAANK
jgi:hypothetical protein